MKYTDNPLNLECKPLGQLTEEQYVEAKGYRMSVVAAAEGPAALQQVFNTYFDYQSDATRDGILAHMLVLQQELFEETYQVFPGDTVFTKKLKEEWASKNKTPIKAPALADALRWANTLRKCPRWNAYGAFEAELGYQILAPNPRDFRAEAMITMKCRADAVFEDRICDLKFVRSIHPLHLQSQCNKYKYPIKAAFQAMAAGKDIAELVCVSKEQFPGIMFIDIPVESIIDKCSEHIDRLCEIDFAIQMNDGALDEHEDWADSQIPMKARWIGGYDLEVIDE